MPELQCAGRVRWLDSTGGHLSDTTDFLRSLWPTLPDGSAVQMWRLSDKKTFTFPNLEAGASWARQHKRDDIYIGAGLAPSSGGPSKQRTLARNVAGIPGMWADIDVNGGPEGKTGAAPDRDAAIKLAHSIIDPTIIVNSGYGIQAWWLFEHPWIFEEEAEREQGAQLVQGFQAAMRANARSMDFTLDSTHDLARLMRLPGTNNCKGVGVGVEPTPVEIILMDGPRYTVDVFSDAAKEHMAVSFEAMRMAGGEGIEIELRGGECSPPMMKIEELKRIEQAFAFAWEHGKGFSGRPPKKSMNEWDMTIANYLAHAGFDAQEICDSLTYHRLRFEDPKGKHLRHDYMARTIGKAIMGAQNSDDGVAESHLDAVDDIAIEGKSSNPNPVRTASLFSNVLGGPEIKRLVQDGRDPVNVQYRLELADGSEVPLGGANNLLEYAKFRQAFMIVTGHLPPRIKADKWDDVIRAMLKVAEVNEEDSRTAIVHSWLEGYLDYGLSTDRDAACQACDPYMHTDVIHVHAGSLGLWLRRNRALIMKDTEIHQYLHAAGLERKTINYTRDDGKASTRSYWVAPNAILPFVG